ncbi:MAG: SgcJ/EcaC family oxidoreductase [Solirubrobacteraceae bacterium]|nr:SgcJ/EcaC family oxidoreductase [Solirubrobacteraceae bacterium]
MSNESEIRELVERWALAVESGDLDGVIAGHTDDVVMFDVPAPHAGVRGIGAYRDTWPPFFRFIDSGAVFKLDSVAITAGDDVAFAEALLVCGTEEEQAEDPDRRLRLTFGFVREDDRWLIAHEHHSFAVDPPA